MPTKTSTKTVFKKALALPVKDRAELARELLVSLDEAPPDDPNDVEAAWLKELDRRARELESGKTKTEPWAVVHARIASRLKRRKARAG